MPNPSFIGYLNNPYLTEPYLGDTGMFAFASQVELVIANAPKTLGAEVLRQIVDSADARGMETARTIADRPRALGAEVLRQIVDEPDARGMEVRRQIVDRMRVVGAETELTILADDPVGAEVDRQTTVNDATGAEVLRQIVDRTKVMGAETTLEIDRTKLLGAEVLRRIVDHPDATGMEVLRRQVDRTKAFGMEIRRDHSIAHWFIEELGYLGEPYLTDPYLGPGLAGQMGWEVERHLNKQKDMASQVERLLNKDKKLGMEVLLRIVDRPDATGAEAQRILFKDKDLAAEVLLRQVDRLKTAGAEVLRRIVNRTDATAAQVNRYRAQEFAMQVRLVLYNTNRMRILCDFPSRGTSGLNWTATSTAAGDFSANNLNTDIVEQVWRSATGVTSVVLNCDTEIPQGTSIDTLALLNHNLTTEAIVTVEGADNPSFSPVEQSFAVVPTRLNAYYIAPTFPTLQSRYWRLIIADPTNPNNKLQIGTIVFGTSVVFQGECHTDNVTRKWRHFADKVPTEGFTNVSNDRALKRAIGLEFKFLRFQKGNYKALVDIFEHDRTSIKCLWIPDPQEPTRFGVFGKLVQIPDEVHRNLGAEASDTVDFNLEVDESL